MKCSKLNSHLYEMKIVNDPLCNCGQENEDETHYFFNCPHYTNQRRQLMQTIHIHHGEINIILNGNKDSSAATNTILFETVADYIDSTQRF